MNKLDLKRPAQNFTYCDLSQRFEKTLEFFLDYGFRRAIRPVLDIGAENAFGKKLAERLEYEYIYTEGNLDDCSWEPSDEKKMWSGDVDRIEVFRTVTCFEVLEHLMNPAMFMKDLKQYVAKDVMLIVSLPRHLHPFFWSRTHFHEFDEKRTLHLFEATGYEVRVRRSYVQWPVFSEFFKGKKIGRFWIPGIRPMLRLFTGYFLLSLTRRYFYTLTLKKEVT